MKVWKRTLLAGDYLLAWDYQARLGPSAGDHNNPPLQASLIGTGSIPLAIHEIGWNRPWQTQHFHHGYLVSPDTPPAQYRLQIGSTDCGAVTVLQKPPTLTTRVLSPSGSSDADSIERELRSNNLMLMPGVYYLNRAVNIPPNRTIMGFGSTLIGPSPKQHIHGAMLRLNDNVTLRGITFASEQDVIYHDNSASRVRFLDCTFLDCSLGYYGHGDGNLYHRCLFDRASAGQVSGGLFLDCRWTGRSPKGHAFLTEGAHAALAMVGCEMDGVDRGPYYRSGWGPCDEPLISGLRIRHAEDVNGGELISCEGTGPGIKGMIVLGLRAWNCNGQVNLWEGNVQGAKFVDGELHGGMGIQVAAQNGAMRDIAFEDYELHGGNCAVDGNTAGITFTRVHVSSMRRTRGNQPTPHGPGPQNPYTKQAYAFSNYSPAQPICTQCTMTDFPDGLGGYIGVIWRP